MPTRFGAGLPVAAGAGTGAAGEAAAAGDARPADVAVAAGGRALSGEGSPIVVSASDPAAGAERGFTVRRGVTVLVDSASILGGLAELTAFALRFATGLAETTDSAECTGGGDGVCGRLAGDPCDSSSLPRFLTTDPSVKVTVNHPLINAVITPDLRLSPGLPGSETDSPMENFEDDIRTMEHENLLKFDLTDGRCAPGLLMKLMRKNWDRGRSYCSRSATSFHTAEFLITGKVLTVSPIEMQYLKIQFAARFVRLIILLSEIVLRPIKFKCFFASVSQN